MRVHVRTLMRHNFEVDVDLTSTVKEMKDQVFNKLKELSVDEPLCRTSSSLRLMLEGRKMADEEKLSEYEALPKTTLVWAIMPHEADERISVLKAASALAKGAAEPAVAPPSHLLGCLFYDNVRIAIPSVPPAGAAGQLPLDSHTVVSEYTRMIASFL